MILDVEDTGRVTSTHRSMQQALLPEIRVLPLELKG
jgi:hypothetical protein